MDMQLVIARSISTDISLCVCVCVCVYIYIYIYIHTYSFIYLYVYRIFAPCNRKLKKSLVFDLCPFVYYKVAILEKLT
jgi:hypothetical protein